MKKGKQSTNDECQDIVTSLRSWATFVPDSQLKILSKGKRRLAIGIIWAVLVVLTMAEFAERLAKKHPGSWTMVTMSAAALLTWFVAHL